MKDFEKNFTRDTRCHQFFIASFLYDEAAEL